MHRAPEGHPVQRDEAGVARVRPAAEALHSLGQLCVRLRRVEVRVRVQVGWGQG